MREGRRSLAITPRKDDNFHRASTALISAYRFSATGFNLLDLAKIRVRPWVICREAGVGRKNRSVGVAGAKALDANLPAIGRCDGDGFVNLTFDAEAVLNCVRSANTGIEAHEVGRNGAEVGVGREGEDGVLNLDRMENGAVMELDGGRKVSAGTVVEDSGTDAQDCLAFARGVSDRDAWGKIVVVRQEGLPVVA